MAIPWVGDAFSGGENDCRIFLYTPCCKKTGPFLSFLYFFQTESHFDDNCVQFLLENVTACHKTGLLQPHRLEVFCHSPMTFSTVRSYTLSQWLALHFASSWTSVILLLYSCSCSMPHFLYYWGKTLWQVTEIRSEHSDIIFITIDQDFENLITQNKGVPILWNMVYITT